MTFIIFAIILIVISGIIAYFLTIKQQESTDPVEIKQSSISKPPNNTITGQFIKIQKPNTGKKEYLNIAELQVFIIGEDEQEVTVSLGKPVSGSSLWSKPHHDNYIKYEHLNDDDTATFANNADATEDPAWFEIDLEKEYPIHHVKVINRIDCCQERIIDCNVVISDKDHKIVWESDTITKNQPHYSSYPSKINNSFE